MSSVLREHRDKKHLVTIERASIGESTGEVDVLHGLIVDFSGQLLLVKEMQHGQSLGLRLIRRADVTELRRSDESVFQRDEMESAALLKEAMPDYGPALLSLRNFLKSRRVNETLILEDELASPKDFYIGALSRVDAENVWVRFISPTGDLSDEAVAIPLVRVTSCRVGLDAKVFYARHLGSMEAA